MHGTEVESRVVEKGLPIDRWFREINFLYLCSDRNNGNKAQQEGDYNADAPGSRGASGT
jgi:hypothetical protein